MKDNTSITIADPHAAVKFIDAWEMRMNEMIWRQMGMTVKRAKAILSRYPERLPWYRMDENYSRSQAEAFLKAHTIDTAHVTAIAFSGIETKQHPEYEDACICSARYHDVAMIQSQLDVLNENREFVYEKLMSHLF